MGAYSSKYQLMLIYIILLVEGNMDYGYLIHNNKAIKCRTLGAN